MVSLDRRINVPELMDSDSCTDEELRGALKFLRLTNDHFGGKALILKHLDRFSRGWTPGKTVQILDVGCGLGDIAVGIALWAARRRLRVKVTGLEIQTRIAEQAARQAAPYPEIEIRKADVFSLPSEPGHDYVIASLFLHHVFDDRLDELLRKLDLLARRGLILSDLQRTLPTYYAVKLLSALAGSRLARHDGPLSVRRAFTVPELTALADRNGLRYLTARPERFFRLSLAGEKR